MHYLIKLLIIFLSCLSTALIYENFMSFNFKKRINKAFYVYFAFCIALNVIVNIIGNTYLNYCWSIIYVLFVSLYLYKSDKNNTFLPLFLLFISICVEETIICYFLEWFYVINDIPFDNFYYIAVFCSNIVLILFYKPIKKLLSKKFIKIEGNYIFEFLFIFMSLIGVIMLSLFMKINLPTNLLIVLIMICIIILCFDIYIVFIVEKINENNKLKEEIKLIRLNDELNSKYYQSKLEHYNLQAKLFHDIKHHLFAIESLYENHHNSKAKEYSSKLIEIMSYKSISINSKVMRILINDFIEKCENLKIKLEYSIDSRIEYEGISDIDLVIIYSNLFTNAIEAVEKCKDPFIKFKIIIHNEMIVTILSNNYIGEINVKNNKITTTKKNHIGIGLENIDKIIKKNNGFYDIEHKNNVFTIEIILPLNNEVGSNE